MELSKYLDEYKTITLELMDAVKKDLDLDLLIKKREDILNLINALNFNKQEIKNLGQPMNLLKLEDELQSLIKKEQSNVKKQIENLKRFRQANTNYNNIENRARVFNKSV